MSGPKAFVVVGETDWWSTAHKNVNVAIDSRLRSVSNPTGNGEQWRSVYGSVSPPASVGAIYYFEIGQIEDNVHLLGVSENRANVNSWMANTAAQAVAVWVAAGNIYKSGAVVQSGLPTSAASGDKIGVAVEITEAGCVVQFYRNRVPYGSAVSLSTAVVWVGWSTYSASALAVLCCDAEDLPWLPPGAQPWGAAARIADGCGHSRVATLLDGPAHPSIVVDSFKRTAYGSASSFNKSIRTGALDSRGRSGLLYVEMIVESWVATPVIGLAVRGEATGAYVGAGPDSWGYAADGNTYHSGPGTPTGYTYNTGDRVGVVWSPASGKLWFFKNGVEVNGGDPVAGTGAAYSNANGDLVPAMTVGGNGARVRICTHAREQIYLPGYAEALDGSDLLPELAFDDRIAAVPRVRREISFFPWASQRQRGESIGNLDLDNADGRFDQLSEWALRNQPIVAYSRRADGTIEREWTGVVDSIDHPSAEVCRIEVADATAPLDVRVPSPKLLLGAVSNLPLEPRQDAPLVYDIAQTPWVYGELQDRGLPYALGTVNWRFKSSAAGAAIERTSAPIGYQGFIVQKSFYALGQIAITNGDLASWSGGAPVGWSVHTWSSGSTVTQNGTAARIKGGASGGAGISQTFAVQAGRYYGLKVTISQYHAGTENNAPSVYLTDSPLGVVSSGSWNGTSTPLHAAKAAGEFWAPFFLAAQSGWTSILVACFAGSEFSIDSVELYELADLSTVEGATRYLLQALPTSPVPFDWTECPGYPTGGRHGTWASQQPTIRQQLGAWLAAELADHWTDANGRVQIAWLLPPEEFTSGAHYLGVITEDDMRSTLRVEADTAPGLTDSWGYSENFAKLNDTDLAGSTFAAIRAYLTAERLVAKLAFSGTDSEDAGPFDDYYAHAINGRPHVGIRDNTQTVLSALTGNDPDTVIPANRWNSLIRQHRCYPRGKQRKFWSFEMDRDLAQARGLRPGGVFTCQHSRYGLASGKPMQVIAVESALTDSVVAVRAWG